MYTYHRDRSTQGQRYVENICLKYFFLGFAFDAVIIFLVYLIADGRDIFILPIFSVILLLYGQFKATKKLKALRKKQLSQLLSTPGGRDTKKYIEYLQKEEEKGYGFFYVLRPRGRNYNKKYDPPVAEYR